MGVYRLREARGFQAYSMTSEPSLRSSHPSGRSQANGQGGPAIGCPVSQGRKRRSGRVRSNESGRCREDRRFNAPLSKCSQILHPNALLVKQAAKAAGRSCLRSGSSLGLCCGIHQGGSFRERKDKATNVHECLWLEFDEDNAGKRSTFFSNSVLLSHHDDMISLLSPQSSIISACSGHRKGKRTKGTSPFEERSRTADA